MRGGESGNLSPAVQLRLPSSAVSGMGGMSSVPCARERAELVRAWWVTASGSGVAICGDTGTKLDRSVPAGLETEPARDPGKSPRAGCLGHHHQSFKSDTMSAVHPAPLSSLQGSARGGFCADTPFLPISWGGGSPQSGETEGRRVSGGVSATSSTASRRSRAGPFDPRLTPRPTSPHVGKKERALLSPDSFRGLAAFQAEVQPGPGTEAGGSERCISATVRRTSRRRSRPVRRRRVSRG